MELVYVLCSSGLQIEPSPRRENFVLHTVVARDIGIPQLLYRSAVYFRPLFRIITTSPEEPTFNRCQVLSIPNTLTVGSIDTRHSETVVSNTYQYISNTIRTR